MAKGTLMLFQRGPCFFYWCSAKGAHRSTPEQIPLATQKKKLYIVAELTKKLCCVLLWPMLLTEIRKPTFLFTSFPNKVAETLVLPPKPTFKERYVNIKPSPTFK